VTHRYYLADRVAAGIDIVDTATNKLLDKIGGFVGEDAKGTKYWGPSGVVVIPSLNQAWAGDGDSTVDLQTQKLVDTISTGRQPARRRTGIRRPESSDHDRQRFPHFHFDTTGPQDFRPHSVE
jgi:hypothetical protein